MTSVNTNASATTALRTLQQTNKALETTQNRISTGLKIGEAKDNAAYWSISTTLKSDNKSLATVKDALGLGAATVDVAYQGLNKAKEVLDEIKTKLTSATQAGVDRAAVQADIDALQDQLKSISTSSNFSGENWLSVNSAVAGYSSTKSVVASYSRDANNAVSIGTVDVDTSKLALFDSNTAGGGIVSAQVALKKADGSDLLVGGKASTGMPVSTQGLTSSVGTAGTSTANATSASISLGKLDFNQWDLNDSITFNLAVDGGTSKAVTLNLKQFATGGANAFIGTLATDLGSFKTGLASAIEAAGFAEGAAATDDLTLSVDTTSGEVKIASKATGTSSTIAATSLTAVNGDNVTTSLLGMTNAAATQFGTATAATSGVGTFAAASAAVGDKLAFKFQYGGDVYQTSLTYDASSINADITQFKNMVNLAVANATKVSDGAQFGAGKLSLTNASTALSLTATSAADGLSIALVDVTATTSSATTLANITKGLTKSSALASTTGAAVATYTLAADAALASTDWAEGDTIALDVTVAAEKNGTTTAVRKTVNVSTTGLLTATPFVAGAAVTGDYTKLVNNFQAALDKAFGTNVVKAVGDTTDGLRLQTVGKGLNESITVNSIKAVNGDDTTTSKLGLTGAAGAGTDATTLAAATLTSGAAFTAGTFKASDKLTFNINVSGLSRDVTVDKSVIDAALSGTAGYTAGSGTIADASAFAKVITTALGNAGVVGVTAAAVATGVDTGKLKLTAAATGSGSIAISNVVTAGDSAADTVSVDEIDINSTDFKALTTKEQSDVLSAYITVVNKAITQVTSAAASLGSISSRIELQQTFVDTLMDTIDKGVGNLIDADLSEESTRLQALQTKQSLGVQALSIANSGTQNILRLFQ